MSLFKELKRRNVFRVGIAYAITAWLLLQLVDLVLENVNAPDWVMQVFMLALAMSFVKARHTTATDAGHEPYALVHLE